MVITDLFVAKQSGDDQLNFNITLEKARKVTIGKTVLASINASNSTAKGKEIKNKTAIKSSEGTKNSGNTTSASNKTQQAYDASFYNKEDLEAYNKSHPRYVIISAESATKQ